MKKIFFVAGLVFITNLLHSQTRVLFIGNSYTAVNNLPQLTADCALSIGFAGFPMEIASSTPGGTTFQSHTTNSVTQNLIAQGNWDYVVLQEQSQLPSFPDAQVQTECFPFAAQLNSQILAADSCAETVFYMTWGRQNGDAGNCASWPPVCTYEGMDSLLYLRYMEMAAANHALVSPVGAVWKYIRTTYPEINLYNADGSHPSLEGSYAAACSMIAVLLRSDPTLINFNSTLDPMTAEKIKLAAQQVVFNNLLEWHVGEYDSFITANPTTSGLQLSMNNQSPNNWNFVWDFGDGANSIDFSPSHTYSTPGNYILSCSATDACSHSTNSTWEISIIADGETEINPTYRIRSLSNEFIIEFDSPATNLRVFDLYGRLLENTNDVVTNFIVKKASHFQIIQFEMNGLKKQILLGVE